MFGTWTHLIYRRRWFVIAIWLVLLPVTVGIASQVGSVLGPGTFDIPGSQSLRATNVLRDQFHQNALTETLIVVRPTSGTIATPAFKQAVAAIDGRVRSYSALDVTAVDNPLVSGNSQLIARDHRSIALLVSSALADQNIESTIDHLRALVAVPGAITYVTGNPALNHDYAVSSQQDLAHGNTVAIPILVIVLLLVFGSLVAAGMPLVLALFSIPVSLSGVYLVAHFLNTSIYATNVVEVLGLGIAIDYSLFIVYRFREELRVTSGNIEAAIVRTMETTGRAVFFSGITVAIGLAALLLSGVVFMQSLGIAGILVPVSALVTAFTLLPALLSVLGTKINRLRVLPARMLEPGERGPWHRLATAIMRRPVIIGGIVLGALLLAAYPTTHLAYSYGGLKNAPKNLQSVQGYLWVQDHFPSKADPTIVLVEGARPGAMLQPSAIAGLRSLQAALAKMPGVTGVVGPATYLRADVPPSARQLRPLTGQYLTAGGRTALIAVESRYTVGTSGASDVVQAARALVPRFTSLFPAGTKTLVGGSEAGYYDWNNVVLGRFPYVVGIILVFTYCFLFFAFRSVFLPLKAVLLNLLSVLTAYGLMVLVFQGGVGSSLLSFSPEDGVATWVPIFLFAFLFGLSMDYEVLLLSRVRETWLATGNNRESVAFGLEKTGRLITSAALIMCIAFSSFLLGHQIQFKEFGFGLCISIAVDASLIRVMLVPAIMEVMGDWNWWTPRSLRRWAHGRTGVAGAEEAEPESMPA
jgi:RND superfamily putative drug exporter